MKLLFNLYKELRNHDYIESRLHTLQSTYNNAFLMHPYANCQTGYMEIKFGDANRERPSLHRLVGYHFCWQRDRPDLPFEGLDIHHIASIHDNQAWNLSAMPKAEHIKLHQRLNKAGIVGLKEPLEI